MEWTRTRSVLADLRKFLTCGICKGYLKDPCILGNCDHNFCRKCIEESLGHDSKCPECGSFSWMKDLRVNNQLTMTVNMTLKLHSLIGDNIEGKDNLPQDNPKPLSLNAFPPPCDQEMEKSSDNEEQMENQNKTIKQQSAMVGSVMEFENEVKHTGTTTITNENTNLGKKTKARQAVTVKGHRKARKHSKATVEDASTDEESENEPGYSVKKHKATEKPMALSLRGKEVRESVTEANHGNTVTTTSVEKNVRIRNSTGVKQASATAERDATEYAEFDIVPSNPNTVETVRETSNVRKNGRMTRGTADTDHESDTNHVAVKEARTRKENTNIEQNLKKSFLHREQENATNQNAVSDSDANRISVLSITERKGQKRLSQKRKSGVVWEHSKITNQKSVTKAIGENAESDSEENQSSTVPNSKGVKIHSNIRKIARQRTSMMEKASEADTESDIEANNDTCITKMFSEARATRENLNENSTTSVSSKLRRPNKFTKKPLVQKDSGKCGHESEEETTKEATKQRRQVINLRRRKITDSQPTATVITIATDSQSDSETNRASTTETVSTKGHTNTKRRTNVGKSAAAQVYKKTVEQSSVTELSMESVDIERTRIKEGIDTEIAIRKDEPTKTPQAINLVHTTDAEELDNINEGDVKKSNRATKKITVENTNPARRAKCSKRAVTKKDDSVSKKTCHKATEKNVLKTYLFRHKLDPNSKVNSNLTDKRFDFTQGEDPFHFSFTDAEGNDSDDDDDDDNGDNGIDGLDHGNDGHGSDQENDEHGHDDYDNDHDNDDCTKPSLRSMHKALRNKISKDRRAGREISNPFESGHIVLQKTKSKETAQRSKEKVQFTQLKDRSTNCDQPDQIAIEKDKKQTSSNELPRTDPMLNAVDDEYKENNDTLNIKRRPVRSKNGNIRQYFTPVNNKDTNEDSSNEGVVEIPPKRRKVTLSSEIPRNLNTSSQCSQNAAASSQGGRNIKGETPLHLAAIKGDMALALELINEGAGPNVKDYAGWTPLHEACNHGHVDIVELLLDHNALINIPGHDNDTPLHDAVANGRLKVAKLLVSRGAALTARNKQGLLPMHYAVTKAMKAALTTRGVSSKAKPINDIENVKNYTVICRESQVILGTALKTRDQVKLKKCITQLGGTLVDKFDESVTHIVTSVNENGHCPRTIKNLLGILTGTWIVSFEWINECLRQRQWLNEDVYEVEGTVGKTFNGAKKARLNNLQQMPRLFDGCSFFLRGVFNPPTPSKQDIIKLITIGGGKQLHREPKVRDDDLTSLPSSPIVSSLSREPKVAYHAPANSSLSCCTEFILYDSMSCGQPKIVYSPVLRTAPVTWLMDCISSFQLLDIPDV